MPHENPNDKTLRQLLTRARTIAIVGASSDPGKPSHQVMQQLLEAGYHVIPVNPGEAEVLGQRAFATLSEISEKVDVVDVSRRAEATPPVADEAVAIGASVLWLQLGISSDAAANKAEAGGLTVVMDRCIGRTHRELGIPRKSRPPFPDNHAVPG